VFSWKDHILTFKQADCRTFEKAIERYFRVEVEIKDSTLQGTVFSAEFKDKNLQQILDYFNTQAELAHEIKKDTCFLWKR
jgi:ferric-dicitrate binding protein FerR (iron transport regulator)